MMQKFFVSGATLALAERYLAEEKDSGNVQQRTSRQMIVKEVAEAATKFVANSRRGQEIPKEVIHQSVTV